MRIRDWSSDGALPIYHLHSHLLGEMIEIDVAALVNTLGHIDGAMAAAFPAVEKTIAYADRASAESRCFRIKPRLQKRERNHRLHRGTGRVEALERFVTQRAEEHTSELQSLMRTSYAVFCLKKTRIQAARVGIVTTNTV